MLRTCCTRTVGWSMPLRIVRSRTGEIAFVACSDSRVHFLASEQPDSNRGIGNSIIQCIVLFGYSKWRKQHPSVVVDRSWFMWRPTRSRRMCYNRVLVESFGFVCLLAGKAKERERGVTIKQSRETKSNDNVLANTTLHSYYPMVTRRRLNYYNYIFPLISYPIRETLPNSYFLFLPASISGEFKGKEDCDLEYTTRVESGPRTARHLWGNTRHR